VLYSAIPSVEDEYLGANTDLVGLSGLAILDDVILNLTENGLLVVLVNYSTEAGYCCTTTDQNGLWYSENFP
jgi:hypothetical protein